jgi:hypothetical protein
VRLFGKFVLFAVSTFAAICLYDVAWMKASDYGILPRDIEVRYQLVKLLLFWIPAITTASAAVLVVRSGYWRQTQSRAVPCRIFCWTGRPLPRSADCGVALVESAWLLRLLHVLRSLHLIYSARSEFLPDYDKHPVRSFILSGAAGHRH